LVKVLLLNQLYETRFGRCGDLLGEGFKLPVARAVFGEVACVVAEPVTRLCIP